MQWIVWTLILLLQNFSFAIVSRARSSGSIRYHALTAVFSNGTWIMSQLVVLKNFYDVFKTGDWTKAVPFLIFYTIVTAAGSVIGHIVSMKIERGKMKVGAY